MSNPSIISTEAKHINTMFIHLARITVDQNPKLTEKVMGISLDTATELANLTPVMIDKICGASVLLFKPRINSDLLSQLLTSVKNNDQVEIDCNLQHAVAIV